MSARSLG